MPFVDAVAKFSPALDPGVPTWAAPTMPSTPATPACSLFGPAATDRSRSKITLPLVANPPRISTELMARAVDVLVKVQGLRPLPDGFAGSVTAPVLPVWVNVHVPPPR